MIPKIIHQIWLDRSKLMPETVVECIKKMRSMNPSMEHKLWTYDDIDYLNAVISENALRGINILKSQFPENSNKANVFMSDIYRLAIVSKFGGLYVDSDILAYKPFPDEIFEKRLFLTIPVPGAQWITNGIFGMEQGSSEISESIFVNCKGNFRPTPQFYTGGLMSWAGCNDNKQKNFPQSTLIKCLEAKGAFVDSGYNYFNTNKHKSKDTICVHIAMASWHGKQSKHYKHKILHEENKLHISSIY